MEKKLDQIIKTAINEVGGEVTEADNIESTKHAIITWILTDLLPKDVEYKRNQTDFICGTVDGYNQCLADIKERMK